MEKRIISEETKKKLSDAKKGHTVSEETKKKISEALKDKPLSEETKQKISESQKGKIPSDETKQKMSKSRKGKIHSAETKKKMSDAKKDKPLSKEHKQKISESRKGGIISEDTKRKISESQKGKIPWNKGKFTSDKTKEKIRISTLKRIESIQPICPNIGRNETKILNDLELKEGYNILRQFKVGGYFLDGYIPELNLAIEVDEKGHQYKIEKDIQREEFIKKKLNCEFLRIKDY